MLDNRTLVQRQGDYKNKLTTLPDNKLFDECEQFIWLSAYASNNHKSDYHWMCDYCYDECKSRDKVDEIYDKAHKKAVKSCGH